MLLYAEPIAVGVACLALTPIFFAAREAGPLAAAPVPRAATRPPRCRVLCEIPPSHFYPCLTTIDVDRPAP
jgi:hypothetical protein